MYVCLCHGVSDRTIRSMVEEGCGSVRDIQQRCKAGKSCGSCINQLVEIVRKEQAKDTQNTLVASGAKG